MIAALRMVYLGSAALAFAASGLVTASLFIADRAPHGGVFLGISVAVSTVLIFVGCLFLGLQHHVARLSMEARRHVDSASGRLVRHVNRLTTILLLGGLLLFSILGALTYAILARIDQGFAVFG